MASLSGRKVPNSRFSVNSSVGYRLSEIEAQAESTNRISVMTRTSDTSNTQSIKIFADVEELLSPPTGGFVYGKGSKKYPGSTTLVVSKSVPDIDSGHSGGQHSQLPAEPEASYFPPEQGNTETWLDEPSSSSSGRRTRDENRRMEDDIMQLFPAPPRQPFYRPIRFPSFKDVRFKDVIPRPLHIASSKQKSPTYNMDKILPQPPYHIFNGRTKKLLTYLVSSVGVLAPLSGSVYFPALTAVGKQFQITYTVRMLTVTVHLAAVGIAPLLIMPCSESLGRRPIMILLLLLFFGANIGLIFVKNFTGFMVLRGLQGVSAGPLYLLGQQVISDFSTGEEKQYLKSRYAIVMLLGLSIGPILGGTFAHFLWFQTTFWLISIYSAITLLLVTALLPETNRNIAGNGTIKLKTTHRPLVAMIRPSTDISFTLPHAKKSVVRQTAESLIESLQCLTNTSILPSLLVIGITFAVLATVFSTIALLFPPLFHFSPVIIGVSYLPSGVGSITGYLLMTYRLASDHRIVSARHNTQLATTPLSLESQPQPIFPTERARLRSAWWVTLLFVGLVICYGFTFGPNSKIRLFFLQFFIAGCGTALIMINMALIKDFHPDAPFGPVIMFVGFSMAAIMVGTVNFALEGLSIGAGFSILGGIMAAVSVVMVVQWVWGAKWRGRKMGKEKGKGVVI